MSITPPPDAVRGAVVEVFSSIQGEGIHVGKRQVFLRLAGCNLSCCYCDQPEARRAPAMCLVERTPGARDFTQLANPVSVRDAAGAVLALARATRHHAVAVTGGEPLLQTEFLAAVLPLLRRGRQVTLLETNATLPAALRVLLPVVDIVSMDLKLRSATGRRMPAKRHAACLRLAVRARVEVYAKAVITAATTPREIAAAARLIRRVKRAVPLILQPVSRVTGCRLRPPTPAHVLRLQECAARLLDDVRVIPQTHKMTGQH